MRIPNDEGAMGHYDDEVEALREKFDAVGAGVIVLEGTKGSGFSLALHHDPLVLEAMARTFEIVAKKIRSKLPSRESEPLLKQFEDKPALEVAAVCANALIEIVDHARTRYGSDRGFNDRLDQLLLLHGFMIGKFLSERAEAQKAGKQ